LTPVVLKKDSRTPPKKAILARAGCWRLAAACLATLGSHPNLVQSWMLIFVMPTLGGNTGSASQEHHLQLFCDVHL
jgi:hypothetical protein